MVRASERARNKAQALSEISAECLDLPLGKVRIRNKLKARLTERGDLWVLLESNDFPVDPDGYFFVNPPIVHGGKEDPYGALKQIITDAATYYATHPGVWGRTTTTVFGDTTDTRILSTNATYTTARAGSGLAVFDPTSSVNLRFVGQTTGYTIYEGFFKFDTSSIPDTDTIDSAVLSLYGGSDVSTTNFIIEARIHDWGATVDTADWVAGADLGTKTLVGTFATSAGWSITGYNDFTSDAAFVTNISKTGITYILLNSDRHRIGTAPTGDEYVAGFFADAAGTTQDPKLVINHTAAAPGGRPPGGLARMGVG